MKKGTGILRCLETGFRALRRSMNLVRRTLRSRHARVLEKHRTTLAAGREIEWVGIKSQAERVPFEVGGGVRVMLHTDSVLSELLFRGDFELDERCFVRAYLRRGDVFVDAGANIGVYTVLAAHKVGARGRVYSFEPTPETFHRLVENVRLNQLENVVCCGMGLSDAPAQLELKMSADGHDAWNSFGAPAHKGVFTLQVVGVTTFGLYAREVGLHPGDVALMKIDVEGWEERVLTGAADFLAHPNGPTLVLETNDVAARSAGSSPAAILDALKGFGYTLFRFDRLRQGLLGPEEDKTRLRDGNLVAVKRPEVVEDRLGGWVSWRLRRSGHGLW